MLLSRNSTSESMIGDSIIRMRRLKHLVVQVPRDDGRHINIEDKFMAGPTYGLRGAAGTGTVTTSSGSVQNNPATGFNATGTGTSGVPANSNDQTENRAFYRERIANWRVLAASGDSNSALNLGIALFRGELGVSRDAVQAVQYFRIAASARNPIAMFNIGWAYCQGTGVVQSWPRAIKWWTRAAKLGHSSSARNIALLYSLGIAPSPGTNEPQVDHERAVYWYQEAARLGNPKAMLALAGCYTNGLGVDVDKELAAQWEQKGNEALAQQAQRGPSQDQSLG